MRHIARQRVALVAHGFFAGRPQNVHSYGTTYGELSTGVHGCPPSAVRIVGEMATNRREDQELGMLTLHLLQVCLVYINTLMLQQILAERDWENRLTTEDLRALTPLTYAHVNPYGTFRLDMDSRLALDQTEAVIQ